MGLRRAVTLFFVILTLKLAAAARLKQQTKLLQGPGLASPSISATPPNTYYFDVSRPTMALSTRGSGRAGRTALTVEVSEASVSKFMPIVSPQPSGMTHTVAKTWSALKNLGSMFAQANDIKAQQSHGPRLFPCTILAVSAANDNTPGAADSVGSTIESAENQRRRDLWTETTPSSVLLLPIGQSTAAVGDLLDVSYNEKADKVTLELDLVHNPVIITEFKPHGKQTMDVDEAHYHFLTGSGVKVDAPALLKSLQDSQFAVEGMHVFFKNGLSPTCYKVDVTSDTNVAAVGQTVNVTVTLDPSACPGVASGNASLTQTPSIDNVPVRLLLVGPGKWSEASQGTGPDKRTVATGITAYSWNGLAWATFIVTGEGPIAAVAHNIENPNGNGETYIPNGNGSYVWINMEGLCPSPGPASKLVLLPEKAYRHVHDSLTFTVLALDANGAAAQDANVTLSVFGDCIPTIFKDTAPTGADGRASFTVTSDVPGAVSVVAAAVNSKGEPVTSAPAHVFFFEDRHYIDRREEEYFSSNGDAERYARAAAKSALQQVSGTPVSTAN